MTIIGTVGIVVSKNSTGIVSLGFGAQGLGFGIEGLGLRALGLQGLRSVQFDKDKLPKPLKTPVTTLSKPRPNTTKSTASNLMP